MKKSDKQRIGFLFMLLIMIGIIGAYLYLFFMSDLEKFLATKEKLAMQKSVTQRLLQTKKGVESSVEQNIVKSTIYTINQKDLQRIFANFFHNVEVQEISRSQDSQTNLTVYTYKITALVDTPKYFKEAVHYIGSKSYPIKIEFPITMKKVNQEIAITFLAKVYQAPR